MIKPMDVTPEISRALAAMRIFADDAARNSLNQVSRDAADAINALDNAGVFAEIDEQSEMAEAERHMEAIRAERARKCTCPARRTGMQGTDVHVLGCPAIDVPAQRGAGRMDCPPVGEPLIGDAAREVTARLREQIGAERFDTLFLNNVHAKTNECPTCHATHFKDADALQFHIDAAH